MSAISAIWNILNSRYGLMRIDFNEPYSMRELVNSFNTKPLPGIDNLASKTLSRQNGSTTSLKRLTHKPSTSSLYGTDIVDEEHRNLVDSIARHVVYDCAGATAVMTTNAVSFLLLTRSVCVKNQSGHGTGECCPIEMLLNSVFLDNLDSEMAHQLMCWLQPWTTFVTHCKVYEISVSRAIHVTLSTMQPIYWDQVCDSATLTSFSAAITKFVFISFLHFAAKQK